MTFMSFGLPHKEDAAWDTIWLSLESISSLMQSEDFNDRTIITMISGKQYEVKGAVEDVLEDICGNNS